MRTFALNLLLALVWSLLIEDFSPATLVVGFLFGFALLWFLRPVMGGSVYFRKVPQVLRFVGFLLKEIVVANLRIAWHIVTPSSFFKPGVIAVPLEPMSDTEAMLLANIVTLTPGSFSVDLSTDRRVLYVHVMDVEDPDEARRSIKREYEAPLLEVMR